MPESAPLSDFELLSDLTPDEREDVARLCSVQEFERGTEVFPQNALATHFYGVLEGEVELVLVVTSQVLTTCIEYEEALTVEHEISEVPIVLEALGPGDVFGWSSFVRPQGRMTAAARCASPSRLFSIPREDLLALIDRNPRLGCLVTSQVIGVMSRHLRHRTEKLTEAWSEAFGSHRI